MAAKLSTTSTPGIFRRHAKSCDGAGRCECSYVVVWRHRGKQTTETFRTFAEAREAQGARQAGDTRPAAKIAFGDYFSEWIETYAGRSARGINERSRDLYRRAITNNVMKRWGTWKLSEVEPTDVRRLYRELREEGISTSVIRTTRSTLSALFATAVEDGVLRSSPMIGVRIPADTNDQEAEEQAKALTREELRLFLAAVDAEWETFFLFLAHTGLRISEAIGLRWKHVELGRSPRVRVREQFYEGKRQPLKSRSGRRDIPLSPGMADRLRAHRRDAYKGEDAPVFATSTGSELRRPNVAGRVLKPAAKAAGVPWASFHSFRHSCASLLLEQGKNVKQVSVWLGHSDPNITLSVYAHLLDDGVGDADFLDDAFRVNKGSTEGPQTIANAATPKEDKTAV